MKTIHEIARSTGISTRTLRYYDEIGLLRPTAKSEAGYRLYGDRDLERLQQILFFREFDIPLKRIKTLLDAPELDTQSILKLQKALLTAKKERLEGLISAIDDILNGENDLDLTIFSRSDMERIWEAGAKDLPETVAAAILKEFGSMEAWKAHYLDRTAQEDYQQGCQKLVGWYGSREKALEALTAPPSQEEVAAFGERLAAIEEKLMEKRSLGADHPEVQSLVRGYGSILKALYRLEDETGLMAQVAASFRHPLTRERLDGKYGAGACAFLANAIAKIYGRK